MKTVQDQLATVLAGVGPVAPLDVALHDAVGCILAVVADVDLPARGLAARDGYSVASADTGRAGPEDGTEVRPGDRVHCIVLEG